MVGWLVVGRERDGPKRTLKPLTARRRDTIATRALSVVCPLAVLAAPRRGKAGTGAVVPVGGGEAGAGAEWLALDFTVTAARRRGSVVCRVTTTYYYSSSSRLQHN